MGFECVGHTRTQALCCCWAGVSGRRAAGGYGNIAAGQCPSVVTAVTADLLKCLWEPVAVMVSKASSQEVRKMAGLPGKLGVCQSPSLCCPTSTVPDLLGMQAKIG